jgi:hypothetical protein
VGLVNKVKRHKLICFYHTGQAKYSKVSNRRLSDICWNTNDKVKVFVCAFSMNGCANN